jgi:hypothetical protein
MPHVQRHRSRLRSAAVWGLIGAASAFAQGTMDRRRSCAGKLGLRVARSRLAQSQRRRRSDARLDHDDCRCDRTLGSDCDDASRLDRQRGERSEERHRGDCCRCENCISPVLVASGCPPLPVVPVRLLPLLRRTFQSVLFFGIIDRHHHRHTMTTCAKSVVSLAPHAVWPTSSDASKTPRRI